MVKKFCLQEFGYEVELGRFAQQADGAVWFKQGGTIVLATAVSAHVDEFLGFMPLTVDYREFFSALWIPAEGQLNRPFCRRGFSIHQGKVDFFHEPVLELL